MNQYLETETEEEHAERVGVDAESIERVFCPGCQAYSYGTSECLQPQHAETKRAAEALMADQVLLICSCGHHTCSLIHRFGLPVPIYLPEIAPLPTQPIRDVRAIEIKAGL